MNLLVPWYSGNFVHLTSWDRWMFLHLFHRLHDRLMYHRLTVRFPLDKRNITFLNACASIVDQSVSNTDELIQ